jgi:hypothetical protein
MGIFFNDYYKNDENDENEENLFNAKTFFFIYFNLHILLHNVCSSGTFGLEKKEQLSMRKSHEFIVIVT